MKNIVLANAPIQNGNRGCVALSYCAMYFLDKVIGNGNYKLYLTDSQQREGRHTLPISDVIVEYESISIPPVFSLGGFISNIFNLRKILRSIFIIKKADCIFDIGQGDSFADIYGNERFKIIDNIHRIARLFSRPYVILPQTIGPFKNARVCEKAKLSLNKALKVMARDQESYLYVRQLCPNYKNIIKSIDVAFFLPYYKLTYEKKHMKIGINISALLWNGGYSKNNQFGLVCDYQKLNRTLIDLFLKLPDTNVYLIPHVVLQERDVENDYEIAYELWKEYSNENLIIAPFALGPIEIKSFISELDFFIGARMHSTIAAFSSGVPVVPLAYSRKFNGLYIETLNYEYCADMKVLNNEKLVEFIMTSYENRGQIKEIINNRLENIVSPLGEKLKMDIKDILKI